MTPGGSHAGVRQPAWSADRYRGQPWRRYAEHAVLVLLGVVMAVLSLVDGRVLGVILGLVAAAVASIAPMLRRPHGALGAAACLAASYVAALRGRFDGVDAFLFLGSILTLLLAASALGFMDTEGRRDAWGEAQPFLVSEPGPWAAWSYPFARGRRGVQCRDHGRAGRGHGATVVVVASGLDRRGCLVCHLPLPA